MNSMKHKLLVNLVSKPYLFFILMVLKIKKKHKTNKEIPINYYISYCFLSKSCRNLNNLKEKFRNSAVVVAGQRLKCKMTGKYNQNTTSW